MITLLLMNNCFVRAYVRGNFVLKNLNFDLHGTAIDIDLVFFFCYALTI